LDLLEADIGESRNLSAENSELAVDSPELQYDVSKPIIIESSWLSTESLGESSMTSMTRAGLANTELLLSDLPTELLTELELLLRGLEHAWT
jgi:hypothetical protein